MFMRGAEIVLKGAAVHVAKVGSTALGTIRSIEYAIQNLEEVAANVSNSLADTRKRIDDLSGQAGQPFEYAERLVELMRRQEEIRDALDLTKNQASAQLEAERPKEPAVPEADGDQLRESYEEEWL